MLPQCRRSRAARYSEATTYRYDIISTLQNPCHQHHRRRWRRKERPRRGPPVWREGLRLSLGWLKPPVPCRSDVAVVPAILQEYGEVTSPSPGPGGGGVLPPCERRERELSGRPPRQSGSNWLTAILIGSDFSAFSSWLSATYLAASFDGPPYNIADNDDLPLY